MGCAWKKPQTDDDLPRIALKQNDGILTVCENNKNTPSSYLVHKAVPIQILPSFVRSFYMDVLHDKCATCSQHAYKDLYFFKNHVISVECAKKENYYTRKKIFSRLKDLRHVLVPSNIFYLPLKKDSGIVFQKMKYCKKGDMFDFMLNNMGKENINIDEFVFSMASTLIQIHKRGIFLTDIKLENILYDDTFYFSDFEHAFLDQKFLPETANKKEIHEHVLRSKQSGQLWVRTVHYLPAPDFPYTQKMAIRNDVFALARCIGMLIVSNRFNLSLHIFQGYTPYKVKDDRCELRDTCPQVYNHSYIADCCDCIVEHDLYANHAFLEKIISSQYKNTVI